MPRNLKQIEVGCPKCEGAGFYGPAPRLQDNKFCPQCRGAGKILVATAEARNCPNCNGRGHTEHHPCPPCAHTGKVVSSDKAAPDAAPDPAELEAKIAELTQSVERQRAEFAQLQKAGGEQASYVKELESENKSLAKENRTLKKAAAKPAAEAPASAPGDEADAPATT